MFTQVVAKLMKASAHGSLNFSSQIKIRNVWFSLGTISTILRADWWWIKVGIPQCCSLRFFVCHNNKYDSLPSYNQSCIEIDSDSKRTKLIFSALQSILTNRYMDFFEILSHKGFT